MSGDNQTVVATAPPPPGAVTTFGQTEWRPSEAVKFFRALGNGCLLPSTETSYVLDLMENVEPSESWGLGSAGFSSVAFKGGWGPEASGAYLVRQSGIVNAGSSRGVAVSIVAFPPAGSSSFSIGTEMLTATAVGYATSCGSYLATPWAVRANDKVGASWSAEASIALWKLKGGKKKK